MMLKASEYLKNCLQLNIDSKLEDKINTNTAIVTYNKGYHPIQMGDEVKVFYFIISGIVRGYYINEEGIEMTKCFCYENHFFGSECFRTKSLSSFYVECIEECKCIQIPYKFVHEILFGNPSFEHYIHSLYLDEVGNLENRARNLQFFSAEERYFDFCKKYPDLQHRIPLKYIASYIGIKPGSMSRIRKKLKNQL